MWHMEQGKMTLFGRLLQDLDVVELDAKIISRSSESILKIKIQKLRQFLIFIMPFWESRLWETLLIKEKEEHRLLTDGLLQDLKDSTKFVNYWLQKAYCGQGSLCSCLFHTAEYFYSSSTIEDGDYDWVKCTEQVLQSLESVHEANLTIIMSYEFEGIKEALVSLTFFRKSMANWDFENLEQTRAMTDDMFQRMEDLPRRVMRIFKLLQLPISYEKSELQNELSTLAEKVDSCVSDWRNFRKLNAPKLTLEYPSGMESETLFCFSDDLRNLLIPLWNDLPPQIELEIRGTILLLAGFIKALSPTWIKIFVESGISYVISKHIYILADEAYTLLVSFSSEGAPDPHDGKSRSIIYAQQRIADIRDDVSKIYRNYHIGDSLKSARLILEDDVLNKTPATSLLEELTLRHTFLTNTKKLSRLTSELRNRYNEIEEQFYGVWRKLWSLCQGELECRKDFLTLSLDIYKDITANMPHPTDLLLDLIQAVVQAPQADELLHELHEYFVTMEDDKLFVKLLYSLGKNLVETFKIEGVVDIIKDVEVGVIEAAHTYILFYNESNDDDDDSSSAVETVQGFNASLRHAYTKVVILPMSELEFFDLLVNLKELKESDTYLSNQIGVLRDDLSLCFISLQRHAMKHAKAEEIKELWTRMMKLGRKVDNLIDTLEELPNWFNKLRVFYISEEVMLMKEKLLKFSSSDTSKTGVEIVDANDENQSEKGQACPKDEVSFEEEDSLRTQLTKGSKNLEKISIVGMPGLGKTTLAMSLYKACAKSFYAHAWCYVGQEFQRKELLLDIIGQVSDQLSSDINAMGVEDLAKLLMNSIKKKNYLIVLDDVWGVDAWNALKTCFERGDSGSGSKILLSSRYKTVGAEVCGGRNVVELKLLSPDKSWELLEKNVFGVRSCPDKLRDVGKAIANKCGGLPLSVVIIAGVLKNKEESEDAWNEVEQSIDNYLLNGGLNTLELSYKHLSVNMKQCFLYCRTFLKGREIPKSKLVHLWVAERFVENSNEQESLEGAAEKYLSDLVGRSLLMVSKWSSDNRIQTCRIHDLLHDFCVQKANEEKFLITIDRWDDPASRQQRGRLCFSSNQNEFMQFSSEDGLIQPTPRSLICTKTIPRFIDKSNMSFYFENFKSLTLLDLLNLEINSIFPESVSDLKLLRYLAVRGWMRSIPSSIGELYNLETLIVEGMRGEVDVPYTIFNLSKLRHLLVNKRARVDVNYSNPNSLSDLQSFSTPVLSGDSGIQMFAWLPNLLKLRCIILDESFEFSTLDRLIHLESLRMFYHGLGRFGGKLSFPSNLYKLTLSRFHLHWSEMETIAVLLPQLQILKLLFRAFEGDKWTTTARFKNLKYLRMEDLDIIEWKAPGDKFPILERLVVRRCKLLQKIPKDFNKIGEMIGIEAYSCGASLVKSVLMIKDKQRNNGNMKFEITINQTVLDRDDDHDDHDDDDEEEEEEEEGEEEEEEEDELNG